VLTSTVSNLLQTVQLVHTVHNFPGTGLFGLADSVTGHFGRDISVHKELIKFVY